MKFNHLNNLTFPKLECVEGEKLRFYRTPDGNVYPSVTTVLGYEPKEHIIKWKERVGEKQAAAILENSLSVGNELHSLIEDYLNNKTIVASQKHLVNVCFNTMKRHLNKIDDIYGQEVSLYSDILKLAGRTDCLASYEGIPSVIDFKQSIKPKKEEWITNYFVQGTAYSFMVEELFGIKLPQVVIMIGVHDGSVQVFRKRRKDYTHELVNTVNRVQTLMEQNGDI